MYFRDLELCTYGRGAKSPEAWNVPLLAIGWLDSDFEFETGQVDCDIIDRVKPFQRETRDAFPMYTYRGLHECSLCRSGWAARGIDGSHITFFIPGRECVYMFSGGLWHYLEMHSCVPPEEFIVAVTSSPTPSTDDCHSSMIAANRGDKPQFLWSVEKHMASRKIKRSEQEVAGNRDHSQVRGQDHQD